MKKWTNSYCSQTWTTLIKLKSFFDVKEISCMIFCSLTSKALQQPPSRYRLFVFWGVFLPSCLSFLTSFSPSYHVFHFCLSPVYFVDVPHQPIRLMLPASIFSARSVIKILIFWTMKIEWMSTCIDSFRQKNKSTELFPMKSCLPPPHLNASFLSHKSRISLLISWCNLALIWA